MDKENQIDIVSNYHAKNDLANALYCKQDEFDLSNPFNVANVVINLGYRKINENEVVISKEEYGKITKELVTEQRAKEIAQEFFGVVREETAKKIFNDIGNHLKRYAHIHKYAEQARKSKEEYADGTPVELNSAWEVLSLHKNGYDTYETMCELEENIRNIALSRLLQEFEKDFKLYVKQFGVDLGEEK